MTKSISKYIIVQKKKKNNGQKNLQMTKAIRTLYENLMMICILIMKLNDITNFAVANKIHGILILEYFYGYIYKK